MDSISSLKIILLSVSIILLIKTLFSHINKKSKKKLPPSPPALPFLGHLHLLKPPLHQALIGISNCYGPVTFLRFGSRPAVVISSQTLAEQCFTTHDLAFANRVQLPSVMLPNLIGMTNYGSYWRSVRQIAAVELLSNQRLQGSSDIRAHEVRDMAHQLFQNYNLPEKSERSNGFEKIHMRNLLFKLLLNVTMMMIAGRRFSRDMSLENVGEMKQYRKAVEDWFELSGGGNIEDFFPIFRILDFKGVMKRMRQATDVNEMMAQKLIDEHRKEGGENRKSMIAKMLELQKEDPEKYSDFVIRNVCILVGENFIHNIPRVIKAKTERIRKQIKSLLLGGSDTSTTTIQWTMANLLNNPDILRKARSEIDATVGNERLVEESDMANLPYLMQIINETLRIYPTTPLLVPHESSKEVTLDGYNVPPGTMLLVNVYQIQRNPEIWDEPTKFKPERFQKGNGDAKWMIPFGMGRRRCPGEALAMRKMVLILGTLIQCFDWERVGSKPVDMTEGPGITLPMVVPLEALYRPRQVMIKVLSQL